MFNVMLHYLFWGVIDVLTIMLLGGMMFLLVVGMDRE